MSDDEYDALELAMNLSKDWIREMCMIHAQSAHSTFRVLTCPLCLLEDS